MMILPPSSSGALQCRVTESLVTRRASGAPGLDGLSGGENMIDGHVKGFVDGRNVKGPTGVRLMRAMLMQKVSPRVDCEIF